MWVSREEPAFVSAEGERRESGCPLVQPRSPLPTSRDLLPTSQRVSRRPVTGSEHRVPRPLQIEATQGGPRSGVSGLRLRPATSRPAVPKPPKWAALLCPRHSYEAGCPHASRPLPILGHPVLVPELTLKLTPGSGYPFLPPLLSFLPVSDSCPSRTFWPHLTRFLCVSEVCGTVTPHSRRLFHWGGWSVN